MTVRQAFSKDEEEEEESEGEGGGEGDRRRKKDVNRNTLKKQKSEHTGGTMYSLFKGGKIEIKG